MTSASPDIDGYEVARRLRAALGAAVRLVALTGKAGEEDRKRCLDAGFNEHLAKPVTVDDLNRVLVPRGKRYPAFFSPWGERGWG